jgi:hypothetical protein
MNVNLIIAVFPRPLIDRRCNDARLSSSDTVALLLRRSFCEVHG